MKIISLVNPHSGCDYHRIKLPLTYLHQRSLIEGIQAGQTLEDNLKECDILFYNRIPFGASLDDILSARERYGFKIVVDIDDYWQLYPGHYLGGIWKKQKLEQQIVQSLAISDAVTCTTDRLYEKVKQYNDNVHVCPNGLPFDDAQFTSERKPSDHLRFIYAGGGSHFWDLRLLGNTMEKLSRHPFNSEIVLAGIASVNIYDKMVDVMSARGKLKSFTTLQHLPLDSYMELYNDGDIALAPLVANTFNAHKSNLKVLEAGCKAIPIIVSDTGPYNDDECPHLMRVNQPGEWYKWIRYCEQNPAFVQDNGAALSEYVRTNYDIRTMNYLRLEAFNSVL